MQPMFGQALQRVVSSCIRPKRECGFEMEYLVRRPPVSRHHDVKQMGIREKPVHSFSTWALSENQHFFGGVFPRDGHGRQNVFSLHCAKREMQIIRMVSRKQDQRLSPFHPHFQFDFGIPTLQRPSASLFIGVQALSGRTEANTQWVKKKTSRFSSPSTDF